MKESAAVEEGTRVKLMILCKIKDIYVKVIMRKDSKVMLQPSFFYVFKKFTIFFVVFVL